MEKSKKSTLRNNFEQDCCLDFEMMENYVKSLSYVENLKKEKEENLNRPSWDDIYMEIATIVAKRSKDPRTKVGAVLVKDKRILGIGYNAEPKNFTYKFDWNSSEKYDYVIHAELNAIANATYFGNSLKGASIYLTLSPCHNCMKMLIQYEIEKVYYKEEYKDFELTKKMAEHSKVQLIKIS